MSMRVLVTDGMDAGALEKLRADGFEVTDQHFEQDELGAALRDYDAVVIRSATKIRQQQIDEAKGGRLKLIIRGGVGVDNIDVKYAEAAGITVRNTPRASSNAVAELAIALLFSCARYISISGHTMREQKWEKKPYSKGFELAGKTIGIVGFGRIGQLVGAKCQALGMNVLAMVHKNRPDIPESNTLHYVDKEQLLEKAEIIAICASKADSPIITAEDFPKMKDGVVIVNVSRAANMDEDALFENIRSGKVKAAGLDVWADEKNLNWALAGHPAVSCTPHIGAGTKEAQKRIGFEVVDIIEHFE